MTDRRPSAARRLPESIVLIFALIVLAQAASYFVPAGEFAREDGRVVEGSYQVVDAAPLPPLARRAGRVCARAHLPPRNLSPSLLAGAQNSAPNGYPPRNASNALV